MKPFSFILKMFLILVIGWGTPCMFIQAQELSAVENALRLYANVPGRPLATSQARKNFLTAINTAKLTGNDNPLTAATTAYTSAVLDDGSVAGPVAGTEYIVWNYTTGGSDHERYLGASGSNYTLSTTAPTTNAGYWTVEYSGNRFYLKNVATNMYLKSGETMQSSTSSAHAYIVQAGPTNYTNGYVSLKIVGAITRLFAYKNNSTLTVKADDGNNTVNNGGMYWSSTWRMQEVNPVLLNEYTINVTGVDDDNAGVQIANNVVAKLGDKIYYDPKAETTLVGAMIKGWECTVKVDDVNKTLTVEYVKGKYDVTYKYVDAYNNTHELDNEVHQNCIYGDPLPAAHSIEHYTALNAPSGTVEGEKTYTILMLAEDAADQPDPTKPENVTLTYRFLGPDGSVWHTEEKGTVANGSAYPAVDVTAPNGVTFSAPNSIVNSMETTQTVDIPCATTFALQFADSYNNIKKWYGVTITDSKTPFHYEENDTYMTLSGSASYEDKYLFALVGNPFMGYKLYNKAAGEGKILSSTAPSATGGTGQYSWPVMVATNNIPTGNNTHWDFTVNGAGYFISRHGESGFHLNSRADSGKGGSVLAFWDKTGEGSRVYFTPEGAMTDFPETATPQAGKVYRIYSVRSRGSMMTEDANHNLVKTTIKTTGDYSQLWVLESGSEDYSYTLRNAETGRFIALPTYNKQAVTQTQAANFFLYEKSGNSESQNRSYYGIGSDAQGTGNQWLNTNNTNNSILGYNLGNDVGSGWTFEEATDFTLDQVKAHVKTQSGFAVLTSGNYYRLVNKKNSALYMVVGYTSDNKVYGKPTNSLPISDSQIWQLEGDEANGYTFKNVLTGLYIKDQTTYNTQLETTDDSNNAKSFLIQKDGETEWSAPQYAFYRSGTNHSLHCADSQKVLTWTYEDAPASWWSLEPVELTPAQLTAIQEEYAAYKAETEITSEVVDNLAAYNNKLQQVFTDAACTELRDAYKGLSNYRLRTVLAALGLNEHIQDMAVAVKNNTWDVSQTDRYNEYVRDFRIADYEPYSDRSVWSNITKVGPFAQYVNPTGITVKAGDVLYVYVGDDVKDSDAQLALAVLSGVSKSGSQSDALHKGLNVYTTPQEGEVFVYYNVTNKDKYVEAAKGHDADYPNIRVHIEGGSATGMWDMHRGMDQEDWDYLFENMLTEDYIHIKGENTIIYGYTDRVRGATDVNKIMKIIDYIFMTEEKLIGHDGQWDGRYKPVMLVLDQTSGNPNWGGGSTNISGIRSNNGEFNYNSLMNERWVYYHEMAHGHQYPVNLAATTESSNNGFAQMVNHEFGLTSRRGNGVKTLIDFKNNGWGWVDMLRGGEGISRENGFQYYGDCVWLQNHLFYQLYLYFHVAGHMPDFWPRLCDEMRSNGGIIKSSDVNNPTLYYNDYFKFAEACAKVSKTDLTEFFDAYGFFGYCEDVKVGNDFTNSKGAGFRDRDRASDGIRYVGDYGSYYLRMPLKSDPADVQRINELKEFMRNQPNKAPNLMFIDDHILDRTVSPDCFAATLDPSRIGKDVAFYGGTPRQGDFGDYTQFNDKNEANGITYEIMDVEGVKNVTMWGDGLVGVKIYDKQGNLQYIYNTYSFIVSDEVAEKLQNGTYTLVAALGNDTNLPLASPGATKYKMVVYNGSAEDTQTYLVTGNAPAAVPYSTYDESAETDVPVLSGNAMALLPEETNETYFNLPASIKGVNVFVNNGTAETPSWSAFGVNLTDKADFYLPEGNYSAGTLSYSRTNTAGLNSVCLPFNTKASDYGEGAKIYEFSLIDGDRISFIEVQEAEAGKFYIVECHTDATWQLGGAEMTLIGEPTPSDGAYGAFCSGPVPDGVYKLNAAGTKFGVTKNGKGIVTAFRGYLNPASPASAAAMPLTLVELGDVNGDGTVSVADVTELVDRLNATMAASNRRQAAPASSQVSAFERQAVRAADFNANSVIDAEDLEQLISRIFKH